MSGLIPIKCQKDLLITIDNLSHREDIDLDGTDLAATKIAHHPETEQHPKKYPGLGPYLEVTRIPAGLVFKTLPMEEDPSKMTN